MFEDEVFNEEEDFLADESTPVCESKATAVGDELIVKCLESVGLLSEYSNSIVRIDKKTKIHRVQQQAAFIIAREADDPLYQKLSIINKKRAQLKALIARKYLSQARKRAREIMAGRGIATGKDMPNHDQNAKAQ